MNICNDKLSSKCSEKPLRKKIDNKLIFEEHVKVQKASQKVSELTKTSSLIRFEPRKGFINS